MRALLPLLLLAPVLTVAGCAVPGGPPLVSAQMPPGAGQSANSEPQPINSLPPGAANISGAPGAVQPTWFALTFGGLS
jgi:hypothetical protein